MYILKSDGKYLIGDKWTNFPSLATHYSEQWAREKVKELSRNGYVVILVGKLS